MNLNIACWNCRGVMSAMSYLLDLLHSIVIKLILFRYPNIGYLRKSQCHFMYAIAKNNCTESGKVVIRRLTGKNAKSDLLFFHCIYLALLFQFG